MARQQVPQALHRIADTGAALPLADRRNRVMWLNNDRVFYAGLLGAAPWLMKGLSVIGTAAMFMVGGGILTHGIAALHHLIEHLAEIIGALAVVGPVLGALTAPVLNGLAGVVAGALVLALVSGIRRTSRVITG